MQDVADGKVDILVGTHKLLSSEIKFKTLACWLSMRNTALVYVFRRESGLMRADVDILTPNATPIPRTLNMAMVACAIFRSIRSIPARLDKTFVRESDDAVVREAVLREIMRGGQVYFCTTKSTRLKKQPSPCRS